jgi:2-isopropylmalate synthase
MREVFGYHVKSISDHAHKELTPDEVHNIFLENYVNVSGHLTVKHVTFLQIEGGFIANVAMSVDGQKYNISAQGNGRLDAVSNAISSVMGNCYTLDSYSEHALEDGTTSRAASYVSVKDKDGKLSWGVGIHSDIMESSVKALVSAINRMLA